MSREQGPHVWGCERQRLLQSIRLTACCIPLHFNEGAL